MTIGKRFKEERHRLKMNQTDFAALGGKTKKTLIDYEKNESSPDAKFLAAIAAAGADVNYILTGQRTHPISEENPGYMLRPDQRALLDNLEHCTPQDQDAIKRMALIAAGAATGDETQQKKTNHSN